MATKLATIIADFTTSLATEIAIGGTSATLQSVKDDDGVVLPNGRYFFTLDGGNSSKEHISGDLTGSNLSNIKTVSRQGTESTGVARKHRIGATVSITDFAHILQLNNLLNGTTDLDSTKPLKYDGTATISDAKALATKKYVDDTAVAGAPNMSLTVKGIGEEATQAEIDAGTEAGGTGAELVVNPKYLKDSIYYTQLPTANEKAAMDAASSPAGGNPFVTNSDISAKEDLSNKDTTGTLGTSDTKYPSQKAVKTYVDNVKPSVHIGVQTAEIDGIQGTETDIIANISLPAGSLSAGRAIRFEAHFDCSVGSTPYGPIFKLYFGGSAILTIALASSLNTGGTSYSGYVTGTVAYVGASSQLNAAFMQWLSYNNGAHGTSTVNEANAQNIKLTCKGDANWATVKVYGATIQLI